MSLLALTALVAAGCGESNPPADAADVPRTETGGTMDGAASDATVDAPMGERCVTDMECSDGLYCNGTERCVGGVCRTDNPPCEDNASCTVDTCDEEADSCTHMPNHAMCSDGNDCNGVERCTPGGPNIMAATGCQIVRPDNLLDCDDGNNCTLDLCDSSRGCVHAPRDLDGDGHVDRMCSVDATGRPPFGDDCNDSDPEVFPGATEDCEDGRDNDCNGSADFADPAAMCRATNDTCAGVRTIPGAGTYWATMQGLSDQHMLSCNPVTAPDGVFRFTLTTAQDVRISMAVNEAGSAVAVSSTCDPAMFMERSCSRAITVGAMSASPAIFLRNLAPGTYFIVMETPRTTAFRFTVRFEAPTMPPAGDACPPDSPPQNLTETAPVTVRPAMLTDDFGLGCNPGLPRPDGVVRLNLTESRNIDLTVSSAGGTNYVSVRRGPCVGAAQLRCVSGSTFTSGFRDLPAGEYFIVVENSNDLDVTLSARGSDPSTRTPGDACRTATVVPLGASLPAMGTAQFDSSMHLTGADHGTPCGSGGSPDGWRDGVFQYTLPAEADVTIAVVPTGPWIGTPNFRWAVENTCGVQAALEGRCQTGGTMPVRYLGQTAGAHYIVVETTTVPPAGAGFRVDITATSTAARPRYEACSGAPIPLTVMGANLVGSLEVDATMPLLDRDAQHGTSCGSGGSPTGWTDVVFAYTLTDRRNVVLDIASQSGRSWFFEVQSMCGVRASRVGSCGASFLGGIGGGTPTRVNLGAQAPGTYYVIAEATIAGRIRVDVTASPAP